ncbi:hypothetical protein ABW19_dt0201909 [Dactylella cylindrospora]|nr:hypothetical protein ABW19_dt0201909 [Dactylella cylindrospora]
MLNLLSLPPEIIYTILSQVSDLSTLRSLRLASSKFNAVFKQYQSTLSHKILLADALKYERETVFLAVHFKTIYRYNFRPGDMFAAGEQYYNYVQPAEVLNREFNDPDLVPRKASQLEDRYQCDVRALESTIVDNHRGIYAVYKLFLEEELSKYPSYGVPGGGKDGDRAAKTSGHINLDIRRSEEERIIAALYRFWILMLITAQRPLWRFNSNRVLFHIATTWTFRQCMAVLVVQEFLTGALRRALEPPAEEVLQRLLVENKITRSPDLGYGPRSVYDSNMFPEYLMVSILLYEFPSRIASWISDGPAQVEENLSNFLKVSSDLRFPNAKEDDVPLPCVSFTFVIRGFLRAQIANGGLHFTGQEPLRICKPGRGSYTEPASPGVWIGRCELQEPYENIDIQACLWDDWRLENWGYEFPKSYDFIL